MSKRLLTGLGVGLVILGVLGIAVSLWLGQAMPAKYMSTVQIKIDTPIPGDPHWLQTEYERILSKHVLTNVALNLDLGWRFAKRFKEQEELPPEVTCALLKRQTTVSQLRNTNLIEIAVFSEDRNEAAQIANQIATIYVKQKREQLRARLQKMDGEVRELQAPSIVGAALPSLGTAQSRLQTTAPGLAFCSLLFLLGATTLLAGQRIGGIRHEASCGAPS